jgi:hypothetical protein
VYLRPVLAWPERRDPRSTEERREQFVVPTLAFLGKQLAATRNLVQFGYSWYDHLPPFYLQASTPEDVVSEFER